MARPSRHRDRALIDAAHKLIPSQGLSGLNIRQVAQEAGVNLGMFHYHFKSKHYFLQVVLQELYEEFFEEFEREATKAMKKNEPSFEQFQRLVNLIISVVGRRRVLFSTIAREAMGGSIDVRKFLMHNIPRHGGILFKVIQRCQKEKTLRADLSPFQIITLCIGSLAVPLLLGPAIAKAVPLLEKEILSDKAVRQRMDFVLGGLRC